MILSVLITWVLVVSATGGGGARDRNQYQTRKSLHSPVDVWWTFSGRMMNFQHYSFSSPCFTFFAFPLLTSLSLLNFCTPPSSHPPSSRFYPTYLLASTRWYWTVLPLGSWMLWEWRHYNKLSWTLISVISKCFWQPWQVCGGVQCHIRGRESGDSGKGWEEDGNDGEWLEPLGGI